MTNWQNRMFRGYFIGISREDLSRETLVKTSCHHLLWLFAFQSCAEHMLHFVRRLLASYPRKLLWFLICLKFSYSLTHTTLIMKSYIKYRYKRLNKITIKFSTKLKPTQISCRSQLYNLPIWLFRDKTPKIDYRLKREFGNNGKTHSHLI